MEQIAPWERVFVRCMYWLMLLVSVGGIVGALVRMRRSGVKLTWETAGYALLVVAIVWAREILGVLERLDPRVGHHGIELFLFGCVCWIIWMYFGPGRDKPD